MIRDHILSWHGKPPLIWCKAGTFESPGKGEIDGFPSKSGSKAVPISGHCVVLQGLPLRMAPKSRHISSESPASVQLNPRESSDPGMFLKQQYFDIIQDYDKTSKINILLFGLGWSSKNGCITNWGIALWQGLEAVTQRPNRYLDIICMSHSICD